MPTEQEMRKHRCCFTGQRPEKLTQSPEEVQQWLTEQISTAINDGFVTFITGMAMGVDIWAGEIVLRFRERDPRIHLIAAVPWPGFSSRWNDTWRKRYERLLKSADLVRYISQQYDSSVFMKRNTWMVNHSARVIAFYNGASGGTRNTIEYAEKQGVEVVVGGEEQSAAVPESDLESQVSDPSRPFPLNLLDAILNCDDYRNSAPVKVEDIPNDFGVRLRAATSIIKDERVYSFLMARYRDGKTLRAIAEEVDLSHERIRQLLDKYLKRLRNPDVLRFLNCGIQNIPEKSAYAMAERLNACYKKERATDGKEETP